MKLVVEQDQLCRLAIRLGVSALLSVTVLLGAGVYGFGVSVKELLSYNWLVLVIFAAWLALTGLAKGYIRFRP
jgi:hypothetical protein